MPNLAEYPPDSTNQQGNHHHYQEEIYHQDIFNPVKVGALNSHGTTVYRTVTIILGYKAVVFRPLQLSFLLQKLGGR